MPVEIERKFLVTGDGWRAGAVGEPYRQGYLGRSGRATVRVRVAGRSAFLTVKGEKPGRVRAEFEYPIPVEDAEEMLRTLCGDAVIEKTRYEVVHAGRVWHVDEFGGANRGLVLAELELDHPDGAFERPDWVDREVTEDPRYRNSSLVETPMTD